MEEDNKKNVIPTATIEKFLSIQEKELMVREKELEHSKQAKVFDHEYALKALDAQVKDQEGIRRHESRNNIYIYIFSGTIIIGLFFLLGLALIYNKDPIVMEIIKAIMYFGAGALGGYSWGKSKENNDKSNNE